MRQKRKANSNVGLADVSGRRSSAVIKAGVAKSRSRYRLLSVSCHHSMSENDGLVGRPVDLHGMVFVGVYARRQHHPFLCRPGEYVTTLSLASIEPVWIIECAGTQSKDIGEPFEIQE